MQRIIKLFIGMLAIVALVGVVIFSYIYISGVPSYQPKKVTFEVNPTPEKVENGLRLASMICNHCHKSRNINSLTGRFVEDVDPAFGKVYSTNITQDLNVGIGKWSESELAYFLRTGIKPNGQYAPPYMPKFPLLSDYDLESIIAFLKSNHPLVTPKGEEPPASKPSFLTKFLTRIVFKPYKFSETRIERPSETDPIELGKYLATAQIGCFQCHSASLQTNKELSPEESEGYFGGGNILYNLEGRKVPAPNITMDNETGIGLWTPEEFLQAVKWGKRKNKPPVRYPMLPYTRLNDDEVMAIYAYLKTVPEINNKVVLE